MGKLDRRALALVGAIGFTTIFGTSISAGASESDYLVVGGSAEAIVTTDAGYDLGEYSRQSAQDLDTVLKRYAGQEQFLTALGTIQAKWATIYSAASLVPGEGYEAWISFTSKPNKQVLESLDALPLRVQVRWDALANEATFQYAQESIYNKVLLLPGVDQAKSEILDEAGEVLVEYSLYASASETEVRAALDALANSATVPVSFRESAVLHPVVLVASHGGEAIVNCTAGFSVTYGGGSPGVSSAGHCNNTSPTTYSGVTSYFAGEVFNSSYDVQWNSISSGGITNTFRYTSGGGLRAATSTTTPVAGQVICYYGKTTGNHCKTVTVANTCASGGSCNSFELSGGSAAGGDSGGPAYYSNSAAGFVYATNGSYDYGQRISSLTSNGVFVKITP